MDEGNNSNRREHRGMETKHKNEYEKKGNLSLKYLHVHKKKMLHSLMIIKKDVAFLDVRQQTHA